jgi:predicted XRE-type DNA-binding protein
VPSFFNFIQATEHEVFILVSSVKQAQVATVLNVNESFIESVSHGAPPKS